MYIEPFAKFFLHDLMHYVTASHSGIHANIYKATVHKQYSLQEEEQRESITEGKLIVDVKIQTLPEADFLKNNVSLYFETPHLMFKYHYVHVDETRNPPAPDLLHSKIPRDCRQFTELPAANGHNMS